MSIVSKMSFIFFSFIFCPLYFYPPRDYLIPMFYHFLVLFLMSKYVLWAMLILCWCPALSCSWSSCRVVQYHHEHPLDYTCLKSLWLTDPQPRPLQWPQLSPAWRTLWWGVSWQVNREEAVPFPRSTVRGRGGEKWQLGNDQCASLLQVNNSLVSSLCPLAFPVFRS